MISHARAKPQSRFKVATDTPLAMSRILRVGAVGGGLELLKLRVRLPLPFTLMRTTRILVPADREREADKVVSSQFAQWAGRMIAWENGGPCARRGSC